MCRIWDDANVYSVRCQDGKIAAIGRDDELADVFGASCLDNPYARRILEILIVFI